MTANTYPIVDTFGSFIVELETATPGTYAPFIGFDQKALNLSAGTSPANLPPTNNPDAPGWDIVGVGSLKGQFQGQGVYAEDDAPIIEVWFDSGLTKNIRFRYTIGYRAGPAVLTALGQSVARNQNANIMQRSMTIEAAGPWNFVAGAPA